MRTCSLIGLVFYMAFGCPSAALPINAAKAANLNTSITQSINWEKVDMSNSPGILLAAPESAPSSGPIPLNVTMMADVNIYRANNGILDKALEIALIRQDAAGLRLVTKTDPHLWMQPETPMPPMTPGTDPANAGLYTEEREFNLLDYGVEHDGAADYFVLASFAGMVSPIVSLHVDHDTYRMAVGDAPPAAPPDDMSTVPPPPGQPGIAAHIKAGDPACIEGGVRVGIQPPRFAGDAAATPFITVVGVRLAPDGGISGGTFLMDARLVDDQYVGRFSVPVTSLSPVPDSAPHQFYVFSGDVYSGPYDLPATGGN